MGIFGSKSSEKADQRSIDTVIGAEATFEGTLTTKNSICVEGTFRGRLESEGAVILSRSGSIEADVVARYVAVNGDLRGNVKALQQLDVECSEVPGGDDPLTRNGKVVVAGVHVPIDLEHAPAIA